MSFRGAGGAKSTVVWTELQNLQKYPGDVYLSNERFRKHLLHVNKYSPVWNFLSSPKVQVSLHDGCLQGTIA